MCRAASRAYRTADDVERLGPQCGARDYRFFITDEISRATGWEAILDRLIKLGGGQDPAGLFIQVDCACPRSEFHREMRRAGVTKASSGLRTSHGQSLGGEEETDKSRIPQDLLVEQQASSQSRLYHRHAGGHAGPSRRDMASFRASCRSIFWNPLLTPLPLGDHQVL